MKKYELTAESIVKFGRTLFRIKALVAFENVEEGELGGFVEKEGNLDQDMHPLCFRMLRESRP